MDFSEVTSKFENISFMFKNEDNGEEILVEHPYFDNLDDYIEKRRKY